MAIYKYLYNHNIICAYLTLKEKVKKKENCLGIVCFIIFKGTNYNENPILWFIEKKVHREMLLKFLYYIKIHLFIESVEFKPKSIVQIVSLICSGTNTLNVCVCKYEKCIQRKHLYYSQQRQEIKIIRR